MGKKIEIELNERFVGALKLMEDTSRHVFVTGKAGTGKSTLLEYFRAHTRKKLVVLAPTGVAALNVKGQTIHSFFRFKPHVTLDSIRKRKQKEDSIYQKLDAIVIDEVSMVRADLMDCIDRFMRLNGKDPYQAFGGAQMIFIGDLYQLPPIVTGQEREIYSVHYPSPWFFDSKVMSGLDMELIELEKIYRQKDELFISLLNAIRNNSVTDQELQILNQRYHPGFKTKTDDFCVWLTSINKAADEINMSHLSSLPSKKFVYEGRTDGEITTEVFPAQKGLQIKIGAQIMLLNNDSLGRWVNGSIGQITAIVSGDEEEDSLVVQLTTGETVEVAPYTWEIFRYSFNKEENRIETEMVGSFTQYPVRLAWAVTIHKSQGKTFDRVVIDMGRGAFASGQVYVALSRCTTLDGIVLKTPIQKRHIFMDRRVMEFLTQYQYQISEKWLPLPEKVKLIESAVKDQQKLKMVYLKNGDEKSTRIITPQSVGWMEYLGKPFLGMNAFCHHRNEARVFRVDRILEMEMID